MVDVRPPGDISTHYRYSTFRWQYWTPKAGGIGSRTDPYFQSRRPSYAKGTFVTLPGGTRFRYSTEYEAESWELGSYTQYECRGYRGPLSSDYRASIDDREVYFLLRSGFAVNQLGSGIPTDMRNEAITKALTKIADQKVNLGENLATLGQTIRLFSSKVRSLADLLKALKSEKDLWRYFRLSYRDLIRRGGVPAAIANRYLEYIYGLKPLVDDVYALSELAKTQGGKTLILSGRGTSQRTFVKDRGSKVNLSYSNYWRISAQCNSKAKCTLHARIDPNYQGLRALNQLGLLNPLGLAWDLVPYSFVVDWLLPVGPVLYALSAPAGLIFIDGSISARHSQATVFGYETDTIGVDHDSLKMNYEKPCVVPHTYEGYKRQRITSWPLPGLWFDPDPFRADRSLKAAALALSALSGSRPPIR